MIQSRKHHIDSTGNFFTGHHPVAVRPQVQHGRFAGRSGRAALTHAADLNKSRHLGRSRRIGEVQIAQSAAGRVADQVNLFSSGTGKQRFYRHIQRRIVVNSTIQGIPVKCVKPIGAISCSLKIANKISPGIARGQKAVHEYDGSKCGVAAG